MVAKPHSRAKQGASTRRGVPAAVARLAWLSLAAAAFAVRPGVAQTPADGPTPDSIQNVDRIVAVVGDTAILLSELRIEFNRLGQQGMEIPAEGSEDWVALAREVIAAATDRLLLLQQAKRYPDIVITEEQVDDAAERLFQQARQQFGSDEEMRAEVERSGMNMLQYRQMLNAEARAELLLQSYRGEMQASGRLPAVLVTEEEVAAYFEANAAGQTRPATLSFNQLVVAPQPGAQARDSALAIVRVAYDEIQAGESFEVVARRYSEDAASRDRGGELGWLRRSEVVRTFGDAAWNARAGVAVGPIRSPFGFHLLRVENVRGGERFIRHILVRPEITEDDIQEARALAASFADSLRAGMDPERLANHAAVLDDDVLFSDIPLDQLATRFGPRFVEELGTPGPGDVVGPFELRRTGDLTFGIVQVVDYRSEGPLQLDDVRETIRNGLRVQKQLERYLEEIRRTAYIRVMI